MIKPLLPHLPALMLLRYMAIDYGGLFIKNVIIEIEL